MGVSKKLISTKSKKSSLKILQDQKIYLK